MQILVSCKTTNLDLHGESIRKKIEQGLLPESHLNRLQEDHNNHNKTKNLLFDLLVKNKINFVEVSRGLYWPKVDAIDAVITVGGDGTVLEASHHIDNDRVPVIGIRSSEMSVGYLCGTDPLRLPKVIEDLVAGSLRYRSTPRLHAKIEFSRSRGILHTDPILNDFLYANASPAATSRYAITIDGKQEIHKSSGIWVATPAGSTAAVYAAGGKRQDFSDILFQYLVREPYSPPEHSPSSLVNGFFNPDEVIFSIENRCERAILALDGQHGVINLEFGDKLSFHRSSSIKIY